MKYCKNANPGVHTNDSYEEYGGYCFDCYCAGVPEMEAEINRLKDQLVSIGCVAAVEEQKRGRRAIAYLEDLRSKLASIGIPTRELDAILGDWKP